MKLRYRILSAVGILLSLGLASLAIAVSYNAPCESAAGPPPPPPRMKAVVASCYGPADVLRIEEIAKPVPGDDEVLVKVHAAAANPLDLHSLSGEPYLIRLLGSGFGAPNDVRMGVDFAGTVEAIGKSVTRFEVGDEIFGGRSGAFAEYVTVHEDGSIAHKPTNVSFEQAASVGIAAITALQGLRDRGRLQPGQRVLINGASGGVGTFAVQIAKAMGAEVAGVCSTRNLELVRSLGADRVIDYTKENFTELGEQYDLILDNVSTQPLSAMRRVLKPDGKIVIVGSVSREPWLGPMIAPIKAVLYSPFVDQEIGLFIAHLNQVDLTAIAEWMRDGRVTPVIDKRFPLQEISAAIAYLDEGHARGKVIIDVP